MHASHPSITITAEGGGFVLSCECEWTRYCATRAQVETGRVEHAKKCSGPKAAPEPARAKPASRVTWDDREGATWIDSL